MVIILSPSLILKRADQMYSITPKYTLYSKEGLPLKAERFIGGSIKGSNTADVKFSGNITYKGEKGKISDWIDKRLGISLVVKDSKGAGEEIALGYYIPIPRSVTFSEDADYTVDLDLYDRTYCLANNAIDRSKKISSGDSLGDFLLEAITEVGISIPHNFRMYKDYLFNEDIAFSAGTSYLDIINTSVEKFSLNTVTDRGDTGFIITPKSNPNYLSPVYDATTGSRHAQTITRNYDSLVYNKFICATTPNSDQEQFVATRVNNDPESPYSTVRTGFTMTKIETGLDIESQKELDKYADKLLADSKFHYEETYTMVPFNLRLSDVVVMSDHRLATVSSIDYSLSESCLMSVTVERV